MKRGVVGALVVGVAGSLVAGLAIGLPIEPGSRPVESSAASSSGLGSDDSVDRESDPIAAAISSHGYREGEGARSRGFAFGEPIEVPEPDTALLFGLGMILLGVAGRRRASAAGAG